MKGRSTIRVMTAFIIFAVFVSVAMSTRNIVADRHRTQPNKIGVGNRIKEAKATLPPQPQPQLDQTILSPSPEGTNKAGLATVQVVAGSSLPDCSHACGSCSPCRLVMVSFVCASLAEAETCPMAYKCMCRNKSFPVP